MPRWRTMTLLGAVAVSAAAPASGALSARAVPFESIAQGDGSASSLTDPSDFVVRSSAAWRRVWRALNAGVEPRPAAPKVDFKHSMLLVVVQGQKPSGGHAIAVTGVSKALGRLSADVEEYSPGPTCFTTQQLTSPYHVVRVRRSVRPVQFTHRQGTSTC